MQPKRWQQIDQLFHLALEQEPNERGLFLARACADDEPLRSEVEALISSHEQAESFIETPASDLAAELLAKGQAGLNVGEAIGPYQIASILGIGGMGEVYLAQDTRLGRQVALKLLPPQFTIDPERVRRFEQEARAASALNHPNIVTIHEIGKRNGTQFIVTEFVDGRTLRQRMAETGVGLHEALDMAIQVASALAAAHAAGIVHRDIKPENIMLRADGYLKVLDFGLAKLTERPSFAVDPEDATRALVKTNPGMVMGTVQYMSPEQARGREVDARTDIWSLGVVLYELVTGHVPFAGETPSHVVVSILEKEPRLLAQYAAELPAELERIVSKALRKNREERYQTARDLSLDLKSLKQELEVEARVERSLQSEQFGVPPSGGLLRDAKTAPPEGGTPNTQPYTHPTSSAEYIVSKVKRHKLGAAIAIVTLVAVAAAMFYFTRPGEAIDSLAVLPFVNVGGDPNNDYLSEGISDSIINDLSQLPSLKVISLNSVLRYKGKQTDPQAVGRELNVRAVLMGRLVKQGDDLAISTELVDVRDNRHLWGQQYNLKLADIQATQAEISRKISDNLRLRLSGEQMQRLTKRYTENSEAYQLYILGKYYLNKQTKEGWEKSIEYFKEAIKIDPNFALAYSGLARAHFNLGVRGFIPPKEAQQIAERATLKALELDDTLAEAHSALGFIKKSKWDWSGAEKEYKRALELDPNLVNAYGSYVALLQDVGRTDEAIAYARRADELDPLTAGTRGLLAYAYRGAGQYDRAIELFLKGIESNPNNAQGHFFLGETYLYKGMYQEAIAEMQKAVAIENAPERWDRHPMLAYFYATAGRRDEALKILSKQKDLAKQHYISPFNFALIYAALGDKDQAFEWLEKAYQEHSPPLDHITSRRWFDSLRSDPRFTDLLRRMNLAP